MPCKSHPGLDQAPGLEQAGDDKRVTTKKKTYKVRRIKSACICEEMNDQLGVQLRSGAISMAAGAKAARAVQMWHDIDHPLTTDGKPKIDFTKEEEKAWLIERAQPPKCNCCGLTGAHKMSCSVVKNQGITKGYS